MLETRNLVVEMQARPVDGRHWRTAVDDALKIAPTG